MWSQGSQLKWLSSSSIQYLFFSFWHTSVYMTVSRSNHGSANGIIVFFYYWIIFHCIYVYIIFIHASADGHLGCFHVPATANSVAINMGCMYLFWIMVVSKCMPRNGITWSMVSLKFSPHTKLYICDVMNVLTNNFVAITSQKCIYPVTRLYSLSLHNIICKFYLNKLGERRDEVLERIYLTQHSYFHHSV